MERPQAKSSNWWFPTGAQEVISGIPETKQPVGIVCFLGGVPFLRDPAENAPAIDFVQWEV